MMTKLDGGIGALTEHLHAAVRPEAARCASGPRSRRFSSKTTGHRRAAARRVDDQRAGRGVQPVAGPHAHRSRRRGAPAGGPDRQAERPRSPRVICPDPLRARRPAGVRSALRLAQRTRYAAVDRNLRLTRRTAAPVGEVQPRHRARRIRRWACRSRPCMDPGMAPPGKHAASAFAYAFPVEASRDSTGNSKTRWRNEVIDKITRFAPELPRHRDPAHHLRAVSHADHVRRPVRRLLPRPAASGSDGTQPAGPKGFIDMPIPIDGLYLAAPGATAGRGSRSLRATTPAYQVLDEREAGRLAS